MKKVYVLNRWGECGKVEMEVAGEGERRCGKNKERQLMQREGRKECNERRRKCMKGRIGSNRWIKPTP